MRFKYTAAMRPLIAVLAFGLATACLAQQQPNVEAQRDAMKKLEFLSGKWSGDCSVFRGPGDPIKLIQTEDVQFKLDGLVMLIEGAGRNSAGQVMFRALATISFDETTGVYHFRAFNDGRYLETELKVTPNGFAWGYTAGQAKISNVMRLNEKGEWEETTETTFGSPPPRKSVEMKLQRQPESAPR